MKSSYNNIGITRESQASKVGVQETPVSNYLRREQTRYPYVRPMSRAGQMNMTTYGHRMDTGGICQVRIKHLTSPVIEQTAQLHLENIRRNLEHRIAVAHAKGDEYLVSLLHQESLQLSLCV